MQETLLLAGYKSQGRWRRGSRVLPEGPREHSVLLRSWSLTSWSSLCSSRVYFWILFTILLFKLVIIMNKWIKIILMYIVKTKNVSFRCFHKFNCRFFSKYLYFSNIPKRFSQITRKYCQGVEWDFSEYYWRLLDIKQDYFPADC